MAAKSAKKVTTPINVKVSLRSNESTALFYVNNVEVGHTLHDFSVTCAKIPVKFRAEDIELAKEGRELELEALVQLTLPATLVPGLINALTVQKELYEKYFGPIKDTSHLARSKTRHDH
jgi:hypothetical protein